MKCEKCGYVSFDHNLSCPGCKKDLSVVRSRLGIPYEPPDMELEVFFTSQSGVYAAPGATAQAAPPPKETESDLDIEGAEDFEFTLDD